MNSKLVSHMAHMASLALMSLMASTAALAQNTTAPAAGGMGGGMGMMDPAERFKQLDTNKDGKLSVDEYKAMAQMRPGGQGNMPAGGGQNGGQANGMGGGMGMMDPAERFKQMDGNHDGSVTQQEFTTFMQNMRQNMGAGQGAPPAASQDHSGH